MNRRDLLKFGAGAAAVPAALGQQAPHPGHAQNTVTISRPAGQWTPQLFDAHQNETVIALTELIIPATDTPGAKAALVNRHLDKALHDGPMETQGDFLQGLGWLDGFAIRRHAKPFVGCTEAQQVAMLETLDDGSDPALAGGAEFFQLAKVMTARIYYATEIGFKELNKGGRVPSNLTGCA